MIVRAALDVAVARELVSRNVACHVRSRRRPTAAGRRAIVDRPGAAPVPRPPHAPQRLYPALHLAAHTGMRRGEVVGLKWSDLDTARSRLSISRTLQNVGGQPVEFGVKTRTSRRTVELDQHTRRRPRPLAAPAATRRPPARRRRLDVLQHQRPLPQPRIDHPAVRPHRRSEATSRGSASTTCATPTPRCSSPTAIAIKVVSERLGHAHPAFTMHTYQHLLPGMSASRRRAVRHPRRHRQPVDVYRLDRRETPGQRLGPSTAGRRRR